jgi:hypothetical protein
MFTVSGPDHTSVEDELAAFESLFRDAVTRVMEQVADDLGRVTVAAGEPPAEPGEPAVSMDTLALIATLWFLQVQGLPEGGGEENGNGVLGAALRAVYRRAVNAIRLALSRAKKIPEERDVPEVPTPTPQDEPGDPSPSVEVDVPEIPDGDEDEDLEDVLDLPEDPAENYLSLARNRMVNFSDDLWRVAREQLLEGYAEGESIEELRDRLVNVVGLTEKRATVVARTEVISASNAGSLAMVQYADFTGTKTWLATEDDRTRPTHVHAEGQTVGLEEAFSVGRSSLQFPGDPSGAPEEVIQCRCTLIYTLDDDPSIVVASSHDERSNTVEDNAPDVVTADGLMPEGECTMVEWEATLVVEDTPTGDGRMFAADALSWGELPVSLLWQKVTSHGGNTDETVIVGNIESIERDGNRLLGRGTFDAEGEDGREALRLVAKQFLRGVSVDVDSINESDIELVFPEGADDEEWMSPEMVIFHKGRIRAATLCAIPAFVEATINLVQTEEVEEEESSNEMESVLAAGGIVEQEELIVIGDGDPAAMLPVITEENASELREVPGTLLSAAYVLTIPDVPPAHWFSEPTDVDMHGALTVTDEGRVYGWLAPSGVAHRSFQNRVTVPMGNVDYSRFMGRETFVEGGGRVISGALTMDCGHASTGYSDSDRAMDHYDNACSIVATVAIGERSGPNGGVWVAGAVVPGVTANQISRMMACQLSGDWRPHKERNGWREFAGALLVPVPGFAMGRSQASVRMDAGQLVASAVPVRYEETPQSCGCSVTASSVEIEEVPATPDLSSVAALIARSIGRDTFTRQRELASLVHGQEG